MIAALAKLEWWSSSRTSRPRPRSSGRRIEETPPQTEVFLLPAAIFAEKDGTFTNSARWLQWKWKATDPPGEALADEEILARIFLAVRELYRKEGGARPGAGPQPRLVLQEPGHPALEEIARDINGRDLTTGQQLSASASSGPTARRRAATGSTPALHRGRQQWRGAIRAIRRAWDVTTGPSTGRPTGASCTTAPAPTPRASRGTRAARHRLERREVGRRHARHQARRAARDARRLHHAARGRRQLCAPDFADGPFPEHYEAAEPRSTTRCTRSIRPTRSPRLQERPRPVRQSEGVRHRRTTYRLTEHFHYWTQHIARRRRSSPASSSRSRRGSRRSGIANEDQVRVSTPRGSIQGVAMVTKRIRRPEGRRQDDLADRVPDPLGLRGRTAKAQAAPAGEPADAVASTRTRGRPSTRRSWSGWRKWGRPDERTRSRSGASRPRGAAPPVRETTGVCKYIDTTTCIGCKACEVACQEWNDLHIEPETRAARTYQTLPDLNADVLEPDQVPRDEDSDAAAWPG